MDLLHLPGNSFRAGTSQFTMLDNKLLDTEFV